MTRRFQLYVTAVLLLILAPTAPAADKIEEVEKRILEAWSRVESMTCRVELTLFSPTGELPSTGTLEYLRKGDKELFRMESMFKQEIEGQESKINEISLFDGDFFYLYQEYGAHKVALKRTRDDIKGRMGGRLMFESLRRDYTLKAGGDAKVDGQDVFVIEARPHPDTKQGVNVMRLYVAKETGIQLKVETVDGAGKVQMVAMYRDAKTGVKLDADRFVFKAPDGVQVIDMTQGEALSPPAAPK